MGDLVDETGISIVSVNMLSKKKNKKKKGGLCIYMYIYIKKDFHLGLEALRAAPSGEHR
jgi:hypothetical protein